MGSTSQIYTHIENLSHYKIWFMSIYQGDLGSISQVQMNTFHRFNTKSYSLRKEQYLLGPAFPSTDPPKLLTIYTVFTVIRMLNYLPVKGVFSAILSPKTIMYGETLHYKQHLGVKIVKYYQVHEQEDPSNSQVPQTKGDICLGTSVN